MSNDGRTRPNGLLEPELGPVEDVEDAGVLVLVVWHQRSVHETTDLIKTSRMTVERGQTHH